MSEQSKILTSIEPNIPAGETPSPTAPNDPTRTREAIERRITKLLIRDYGRDEETMKLCHSDARLARRFYFGDSTIDEILRGAERLAALSELAQRHGLM